MQNALFASVTGLTAAQSFLDVTANNLANVNTTGYKTARITFEDLFYIALNRPGSIEAAGLAPVVGAQIGRGTAVDAITGLFTPGVINSTGRPLDVAINGEGFFQVTLPDGRVAYTRDGGFTLDAAGRLTTGEGFLLSPSITIPPDATSVTIGADGTVTVVTPAGPQVVGQLTLARFINPAGLLRLGDNLFLETAGSGPPTVAVPGTGGLGFLQAQALEASNVDVATELVNLLIAQRSFSFNATAITVENQMLADAAALIS